MFTYYFHPMTKEFAFRISAWKYQDQYSIYSMDDSYECIDELMNEEYFCALDNQDRLIGYICTGNSARVPGGYQIGIYNNDKQIDIGLGLNPDFTGKGRGVEFLSQAIHFLESHFQVQNFQLVVASFNERAIKVYERAGFIKGVCFTSMVDKEEVEFLSMNYSMKEE